MVSFFLFKILGIRPVIPALRGTRQEKAQQSISDFKQ